MKKILTVLALGVLFISGCSKEPTEEELARQAIYEENISAVAELDDSKKNMIIESRGVVIAEEENEEEELIEIYNSFSPGDEFVHYLASMTRDELLTLDPSSHMEIFINGVIRDEYHVAANVLYGEEQVAKFKQEFKEGLLTELPNEFEEGEEPEYPIGTTYVDQIGLNTPINDADVARNHPDVIIDQLNRIFVQIIPQSNFGDRITVSGQVYPITLYNQLENVQMATYEFTGIPLNDVRRMSEQDLIALNKYHNETFKNALLEAPISEDEPNVGEIGAFIQGEDGTWAPAQMPIFAWNLVNLVYGIQ